MKIAKALLRGLAWACGSVIRTAFALVIIAGVALANYNMTIPGTGTLFGSIVVATVHYAQMLACDPTTPSQCAKVDSSGALTAKIGDGTNGPVAVKPASTATAATDQSFATNESPNSQLSVATGTAADSPASVPATTTPASQVALLKAMLNLINSATPACGAAPCVTTIGNVGVDPSSGVSAPALAFLALPATATTQIIALNGTKVTYVTFAKVWAPGAVNITFKYGTGTNCGTGTTTLEGPYTMSASNIGWTEGNGSGSVLIVPAGQALCVTTDATVTNGGVKLIYEQK